MSVKNPFQLRKFVIGGVATGIVLIYMIRLFTLQLWSDDYKKNADSNAFRKEILYPSRGLIYDRKGRILVYNEPSYNIMVVMNDQRGVDTLDFCETVGITKDDYIRRMAEIKDSRKIPATRATPPSSSWRKFPPATFPYSAKNSSASRASASKNAPRASIQPTWAHTYWAMSAKSANANSATIPTNITGVATTLVNSA